VAKKKVEKGKVSHMERELGKTVSIFEVSQEARSNLIKAGLPEPKRPNEDLDFVKIEDLVGYTLSELGILMAHYTVWYAYTVRQEAYLSIDLFVSERCKEFCYNQLLIILPRELKDVMIAKAKNHRIMRKYERRYLLARSELEMFKQTSKSILRAIETVSREQTRRDGR